MGEDRSLCAHAGGRVFVIAALIHAAACAPAVEESTAAQLASKSAASFVAKGVCSGVFVAGMPVSRLRAEDLADFAAVTVQVDTVNGLVTGDAGDGATAVAVHREGFGCTLATGTTGPALMASRAELPQVAPWAPGPSPDSWPMGDAGSTEPRPVGVDSVRLHAILDEAFAEPDPASPQRTRAVVIVHGDKIVAERYGDGITPDTRLTGWSMAKSVTSALAGILLGDGHMELDEPLAAPEWMEPGDPRRNITLHHLLGMSSGLEWDEDYTSPLSDPAQMLMLEGDAGAFMADKPLEFPPDSVFEYASGATNLISRAMRRAVGSDSEYLLFPRSALFDRIGMRSAVFELDPSGTFVGSSFLWATARDWARFGLLYLQGGAWGGERILPLQWVGYSGLPARADTTLGFGMHWALNLGGRWKQVPRDAMIASGFAGQYVVVVPSRDAILVRLGQTPGQGFDVATFVANVLAALPDPVMEAKRVAAPDHPSKRDSLHVLFIGNSYTFFNNMPDMVKAMSDAAPDGPHVIPQMSVRGAATLRWHLDNGDAPSVLASRNWDVVVLQEQSRLGVPDSDESGALAPHDGFHAATREWVRLIRANGARPVLFMTWARRAHPEQLSKLAMAYETIARELGVDVAPVGAAWGAARETGSQGQSLHIFDGSHPSPAGSYLAAAVLFRAITGISPSLAPHRIVGRPVLLPSGKVGSEPTVLIDLSSAEAENLLRAAAAVAR